MNGSLAENLSLWLIPLLKVFLYFYFMQELELQMAVWCHVGAGNHTGSSTRPASALMAEPSLQTQC